MRILEQARGWSELIGLVCLYRPCNDLSDILDLHLLLGVYTLNTIVKHGDTEGTGSCEDFRFAANRISATAVAICWLRLSKDPIQFTQ